MNYPRGILDSNLHNFTKKLLWTFHQMPHRNPVDHLWDAMDKKWSDCLWPIVYELKMFVGWNLEETSTTTITETELKRVLAGSLK